MLRNGIERILAGVPYACRDIRYGRRQLLKLLPVNMGKERWQVVRMILGQGGRLALAGVTLGALAAAGVARVLDSLLHGVSGLDPAAYGAAAGVLLLVALGANLVPAVTAARVDPVRALRNE